MRFYHSKAGAWKNHRCKTMSNTKHILAKAFYPIIILATDIEVRIRLWEEYPPRLISYFDRVFCDDNDLPCGRMGYS